MYINQKHLASLDWVMLEIKLPREITKSPLATEVAIAGFLQASGVGTVYARNFEGKLPSFGSLEIASIEGVIHFYVRVQRRFKVLMETNFYAQYPEVEIVEADDYTKLIHYHHLSKEVSIWGLNYRTSEKWAPVNPETGEPYKDGKDDYKMPADFLPIKTYVDYGLDKDPKEEYKTDPLTQLLEAMGSLGKGEHMWYQVIVQDESVYNGSGKLPKFYVNKHTHEHINLKAMADARMKQIRTSGYIKHGDQVYDDYGYEKPPRLVKTDEIGEDGKPIYKEEKLTYNLLVNGKKDKIKAVSKKEMDLTQAEKDTLELISKKLSKPLAVAAIRICYVTKKENFKSGQIQTTLSFPKVFAGANKFMPVSLTDPYDYPWQKLSDKRVPWRGEELFEAYVEREAFYPHIEERKGLDEWEDRFFFSSTMKNRKLFRMFYEALFHPFDHPTAEGVAMTLNLEEIATLWHLPGAVAATPTLPRIDSAKGVAPVNLPL